MYQPCSLSAAVYQQQQQQQQHMKNIPSENHCFFGAGGGGGGGGVREWATGTLRKGINVTTLTEVLLNT